MLASLALDCAILKIKLLNFPDFGFKKKLNCRLALLKNKTTSSPKLKCFIERFMNGAVSYLANRRELHQIVESGVGDRGRKLLAIIIIKLLLNNNLKLLLNALFQARPPF